MNTIQVKAEPIEFQTEIITEPSVITELGELQLALVGGGTGEVQI